MLTAILASTLAQPSAARGASPAGCDLAAYHLARGDGKRALAALAGEPDLGASKASRINLRGLAEMIEGRTDAALASFDEALALEPANETARYNRGVALLKKGSLEAAIAEFDRVSAPEQSALRARATYHRGLAQERLGKNERAAASFEEAFRLDSTLHAALLSLGVAKERMRDFQGAGKAYKMFLERRPDVPVALLRFGVVAHRAGRRDAATALLRRVIAIAPQSSEAVEAQKYLVMWE